MTPHRTEFAPQRPWFSRGARQGGAVLATASAIVLASFAGVTPAYAEEIPVTDAPATEAPATEAPATEPAAEPTSEPAPSEPAPTEPAPSEPAPTEPAPTEPAPTEPPPTTPPPTDPTTPPPTDPTTPPPTDPSTPPPTDPSTPPPTDTSTPPTETPDPTGTLAPGTQSPTSPVVFSGSSPFARVSTPTTVGAGAQTGTQAGTQTAALVAAAQLKIERAITELRKAEASLADARSMREAARATAEHMQAAADEAQLDADAAGRVYLAAVQGDGTTISSMDAVFGAGNDLLAGLGGVARVAQIAGDAEKFLEIASEKTEVAEAAQERADAAFAAVDAVPVEALEGEVASAERAVAAARQELADLQARSAAQSRLASTGATLIMSLPSDAGQLSDQGWALPVTGRITSTFGPRPVKPLPGVNDFHRGTDLAAACNTAVFAATAGVVETAGPNGGLGNWILIDHGSGVATGYGHLTTGGIFVSPGETVTPGQLIGAVGSTGASTGCHLHYEVHLDGVAIDAVPFMAARGIGLG
jgi:murein DD-endopeptidase MepM/ murein hydrolase activator NlpD